MSWLHFVFRNTLLVIDMVLLPWGFFSMVIFVHCSPSATDQVQRNSQFAVLVPVHFGSQWWDGSSTHLSDKALLPQLLSNLIITPQLWKPRDKKKLFILQIFIMHYSVQSTVGMYTYAIHGIYIPFRRLIAPNIKVEQPSDAKRYATILYPSLLEYCPLELHYS